MPASPEPRHSVFHLVADPPSSIMHPCESKVLAFVASLPMPAKPASQEMPQHPVYTLGLITNTHEDREPLKASVVSACFCTGHRTERGSRRPVSGAGLPPPSPHPSQEGLRPLPGVWQGSRIRKGCEGLQSGTSGCSTKHGAPEGCSLMEGEGPGLTLGCPGSHNLDTSLCGDKRHRPCTHGRPSSLLSPWAVTCKSLQCPKCLLTWGAHPGHTVSADLVISQGQGDRGRGTEAGPPAWPLEALETEVSHRGKQLCFVTKPYKTSARWLRRASWVGNTPCVLSLLGDSRAATQAPGGGGLAAGAWDLRNATTCGFSLCAVVYTPLPQSTLQHCSLVHQQREQRGSSGLPEC